MDNKQKDDMLSECMFARTCLFHFALSICHGRRQNSYDLPAPITPVPRVMPSGGSSQNPNSPTYIIKRTDTTKEGESRIPGAHQLNVTTPSHVSFQVLCIQAKV